MQERRKIFLLLFFVVLGFFLRINHLSERSLWTDEFFTLFLSTGHGLDTDVFLSAVSRSEDIQLREAKDFQKFLHKDPLKNHKDVIEGLLSTSDHPPLYFWLMYFWMKLWSDNPSCVRFFSLLCGVLSIFLAYLVSRHLFGGRGGGALLSALFVSISPFCIRYSQEARSYSLVMALGLLSWIFLLRMEKRNRNSDAWGFAIFNCLGFYTHYFYAFLALAQFVYFTVTHRKDRPLLDKFYLAFLGSLLFFAPWVSMVILKGYNFYISQWIFGYPGLMDKIFSLLTGCSRYFFIYDTGDKIIFSLFLYSGLLVFFYVIWQAVRDTLHRYLRELRFCAMMFLIPLLSLFFIDMLQHGALLRQERFWVFPFLGALPLLGAGLGRIFEDRKWLGGILVMFMLGSAFYVSNLQFGPAPYELSRWINAESRGRKAVVVVFNLRSVVFSQAYYLDDRIYLVPVSDAAQLQAALKLASQKADRIFISRAYHRTENSLMNQPFMTLQEIGLGFKLKGRLERDDMAVSEFAR